MFPQGTLLNDSEDDSVALPKATLLAVAQRSGPADQEPWDTSGERVRPFWGLPDAFLAWIFGFVCASLIGALVIGSSSWDVRTPPGTGGHVGALITRSVTEQPLTVRMPLAVQVLLTVPLWFGLLGVPIWVAARKGFGIVKDFRLKQELIDIPVGIAVGIVSQFGLVWVIYRVLSPWIDPATVDDEARELTDRATDSTSVIMLVLLVAIGAPLVEEIFFRGLLFRAFDNKLGRVAAIVGSSVLFGLSHFQPIQFPALVAFGLVLALLVHYTDRLGPAIWAHVAFNTSTVILLLGFS